ncbi:MAG: hypothetical protein MZU95_00155 [Desulfomicrobium escambiense]|nr:hypothetical protein [Desulfomicrobium escambiense]
MRPCAGSAALESACWRCRAPSSSTSHKLRRARRAQRREVARCRRTCSGLRRPDHPGRREHRPSAS